MSFPPDLQSPQTSQPSSPSGSPSARRPRRIRLILWLLLGFVVALALIQAPLEVGRWQLAAALRLRQKNEKAEAYAELDKAIARFPKSPELLLQRAEWKLQDEKRDEAIADCDRAIEMAGDSWFAYKMRGQLFFKAKEFERAVEDFKKVEAFSRRSGRPPLYDTLNELAYAQALAKIDLDEALKKVTEALDIMPAESEQAGSDEYFHRGLILDTRGYLYYLNDEHSLAIDDMNESVKRIEEHLRRRGGSNANSGTKSPTADSNTLTEAAAAIYYHRSLVLTALRRPEEAGKDRERARELIGREPDETLF